MSVDASVHQEILNEAPRIKRKYTRRKKLFEDEEKELKKILEEKREIEEALKKNHGKYFLVCEDILPEALRKTIQVKEYLKQHDDNRINQAVKQFDLSRSAFYRYKDFIFPFFEATQNKILSFSVSVVHRKGMLAEILSVITKYQGNILALNQGVPVQGIANITMSVDTKSLGGLLENFVNDMKALDGVKHIEFLGEIICRN